ncbi:hypothetical protein HY990_05275 [Candidatus Micrarchaeota archaeon]|nr:hypothetical protein [Candidatus Micrarchaeota archaeon]
MKINKNMLLILLIIVAILTTVKLFQILKNSSILQADASKFVLEDLGNKYPEAQISIVNISERYNLNGEKYFELKGRVTQNPDGPCPERSHIFYNYPVQNFIPQTPEVITQDCRVCTAGLCTIAFPEEAIIASHTMSGTNQINQFIRSDANVTHSVLEGDNQWIVTWSGTTGQYVVKVQRDGRILNATYSAR